MDTIQGAVGASVTERRKTIKELRQELGMTQLQLAMHTGLSLSTLYEIETSKRTPRLDTMRKIAGALGVDFRDIAWDASDIGGSVATSEENDTSRGEL